MSSSGPSACPQSNTVRRSGSSRGRGCGRRGRGARRRPAGTSRGRRWRCRGSWRRGRYSRRFEFNGRHVVTSLDLLEVCDMRENHKAITPTTNASKSRLQLTQREISPTHHTLILNGFSNSQKASITQHGPRTACAGCIESQNGGNFSSAHRQNQRTKPGTGNISAL